MLNSKVEEKTITEQKMVLLGQRLIGDMVTTVVTYSSQQKMIIEVTGNTVNWHKRYLEKQTTLLGVS